MNSLLVSGYILKRAFRQRKELLLLTLLPIVIVSLISYLITDGTGMWRWGGWVHGLLSVAGTQQRTSKGILPPWDL